MRFSSFLKSLTWPNVHDMLWKRTHITVAQTVERVLKSTKMQYSTSYFCSGFLRLIQVTLVNDTDSKTTKDKQNYWSTYMFCRISKQYFRWVVNEECCAVVSAINCWLTSLFPLPKILDRNYQELIWSGSLFITTV
jgi:hypothetical protein